MSHESAQVADSAFQHVMQVTVRPSLVMSHGKGSRVFDTSGRSYLDFVQGWAVNTFGHAPELVANALATQAARLLTASPAFHNAAQLEYSDALARATGMDRVFLCSTGAEANEGAIKLARKWGQLNRGGAFEIIATHGGFHGRTLATMAATGKRGWKDKFAPGVEGFRHVNFGDIGAMEAAIGPNTLAVMVEPIQGEGGVVVPPPGYLGQLRELTQARGALLLVDEIQTGMGRTGTLLAGEGVRPDIVTLGKGIGAGVPLAALLASEAVSCFEPGDQGGTYAGNPLMAAVGLAVLRAVEQPSFLAHVREMGDRLERALAKLAAARPGAFVRGRGLLLALGLGSDDASRVVERCRDSRLLVNAPSASVLRFMPALTVDASEIDEMVEIVEAVLLGL